MDAWTFIWLMVMLKIPIVGLFLIVRWAVRQTPEGFMDEDGGIGFRPDPRPRHPHHPRLGRDGRGPIAPRRGPHHGAPALLPPPRVRTVAARRRLTQR
ncbi:MAG TPA: hypothetical protein VNY52_07500 [Solirubrobacteraceae bacterium]|nr:hypothetical protein [Solirubrobacteraceae bacterium]